MEDDFLKQLSNIFEGSNNDESSNNTEGGDNITLNTTKPTSKVIVQSTTNSDRTISNHRVDSYDFKSLPCPSVQDVAAGLFGIIAYQPSNANTIPFWKALHGLINYLHGSNYTHFNNTKIKIDSLLLSFFHHWRNLQQDPSKLKFILPKMHQNHIEITNCVAEAQKMEQTFRTQLESFTRVFSNDIKSEALKAYRDTHKELNLQLMAIQKEQLQLLSEAHTINIKEIEYLQTIKVSEIQEQVWNRIKQSYETEIKSLETYALNEAARLRELENQLQQQQKNRESQFTNRMNESQLYLEQVTNRVISSSDNVKTQTLHLAQQIASAAASVPADTKSSSSKNNKMELGFKEFKFGSDSSSSKSSETNYGSRSQAISGSVPLVQSVAQLNEFGNQVTALGQQFKTVAESLQASFDGYSKITLQDKESIVGQFNNLRDWVTQTKDKFKAQLEAVQKIIDTATENKEKAKIALQYEKKYVEAHQKDIQERGKLLLQKKENIQNKHNEVTNLLEQSLIRKGFIAEVSTGIMIQHVIKVLDLELSLWQSLLSFSSNINDPIQYLKNFVELQRRELNTLLTEFGLSNLDSVKVIDVLKLRAPPQLEGVTVNTLAEIHEYLKDNTVDSLQTIGPNINWQILQNEVNKRLSKHAELCSLITHTSEDMLDKLKFMTKPT